LDVIAGMDTNVVLEVDDSVDLSVIDPSQTTNNQSQITVSLTANKTKKRGEVTPV